MSTTDTAIPAIEVDGLVKRYARGKSNAVDDISFRVEHGEIFGLLGPNGAGKTTTVGVLTTRIRATSGQARVAGIDVAADPVGARRRLGVVPQSITLDASVNVRQNLLFHAAYHDVPASIRRPRADELLAILDLSEHADARIEQLSGGQAQRLQIARALMHEPQVLFADEPTTGLDPQVRRFVWEQLRRLRDRGVGVLLTTHYMDEAAELADRVAIMDHGKVLVCDTPAALTRDLPGHSTLEVSIEFADSPSPEEGWAAPLLSAFGEIEGVERLEEIRGAGPIGRVRARLYLAGDAPGMVQPVASATEKFGARLVDVTIGRPSLEDVFIQLTGRGLR